MAYKKSFQHGLSNIESAVSGLKNVFDQQADMFDEFVGDSVSLSTDMMEFIKRRSELQLEYGRNLQSLCDKQLKKYHNMFERKRSPTRCNNSVFGCFYQLLVSSRYESMDFIGLHQITNEVSLPMLDQAITDLKTNNSNFRKLLTETQNELSGQSSDMVLNIKEYNSHFAMFKESQSKLDSVTSDLSKVQRSLENKGKELVTNSKYKSLSKSEMKRKENFVQCRQKLNKSRNDYLLSLQALTHFRFKLFNDDIPALFENLTTEFYALIKISLRNICQAQVKRTLNTEICNERLEEKLAQVDFMREWSCIYDNYSDCLEVPESKLEFLPAYTKECLDSINSLQLDSDVKDRYPIIVQNFDANLRKSKEISDQIETAKMSIQNISQSLMADLKDYMSDIKGHTGSTVTLQNGESNSSSSSNLNASVNSNGHVPSSNAANPNLLVSGSDRSFKQSLAQLKSQYTSIVSKFKELVQFSNKAARLKARKDLIESTFGGALETSPSTYKIVSVKRQESVKITKYVPRPVAAVNVKLFGGDIDQYCKAIQKDIPPVVLSCIEFIRENGMFDQGIFRISGAKSAVRYLKDYFESGDDPLLSPTAENSSEDYEVGAVAELLKLYFRELSEASLPSYLVHEFMDAHSSNAIYGDSYVTNLKNSLSNLPYSTMVTLRYLFAFLHSLTRFADENMMDAYNLAIVWGPTLFRPLDSEQVEMQTPITLLVQFLILNHYEVFPQDSGSLFYDSTRDRPRTLSLSLSSSQSEAMSPLSCNNNSSCFDESGWHSEKDQLSPGEQSCRVPSAAVSPVSESGGDSNTCHSNNNNNTSRSSNDGTLMSSAIITESGEVVKEASVVVNLIMPPA